MAVLIACCSAGMSGFFLACAFQGHRMACLRQRRLRLSLVPQSQYGSGAGGDAHSSGEPFVIRFLQRQAQRSSPPWLLGFARHALWSRGLERGKAQKLISKAGLEDSVPVESVYEARIRLSALGMCAGFFAGVVFSLEAGTVFALVGLGTGYCGVPRALRRRAAERTADMERHLSEMLEVVMLGLQSGLSFESAFGLYPRYFTTGLGDSMSRAMHRWGMGLATREEALRGIEAEYDSALLSRVIASMVRSMRFGTSVSATLEAVASDARDAYRSQLEERVAKAAVKMMLPVGTLILPAMLILVLGPVMLELLEGF